MRTPIFHVLVSTRLRVRLVCSIGLMVLTKAMSLVGEIDREL
jgi:hypothetical protein